MAQDQPPAVKAVCERFGLTPEELADDLNLLMVCGLPPFSPGDMIEAMIEDERVTITMADPLTRPPRLTRGEAMGLLVMGRAASELPGLAEAGSLRSALTKLARAIAPSEVPDAEELADRIAVSFGEAGTEMLAQIRACIDARERLRIEYWSAGRAEMTTREVDPLLVFGAAGSWYLVAIDGASSEERLFRVDRIRTAVPTGERFERPAGFDPAPYAGGRVFSPSARDVNVVIELSAAARWLAEVIPSERVTERTDGAARLELRTPNLPWLVRLLLAAGSTARAVEPPELVDAVRAAAAEALAAYPSS